MYGMHTLHQSDLRSLKLLKEESPIAKLFVFYGGKENLYRENITILPVAEILPQLPEFLKTSREKASRKAVSVQALDAKSASNPTPHLIK